MVLLCIPRTIIVQFQHIALGKYLMPLAHLSILLVEECHVGTALLKTIVNQFVINSMRLLSEKRSEIIINLSMVNVPNDVHKVHLFNKLFVEGAIGAVTPVFCLPSWHIEEHKVLKLRVYVSDL